MIYFALLSLVYSTLLAGTYAGKSAYFEGELVKENETSHLYLMNNNTLKRIPDEFTAERLGFDISKMGLVSQFVVNNSFLLAPFKSLRSVINNPDGNYPVYFTCIVSY